MFGSLLARSLARLQALGDVRADPAERMPFPRLRALVNLKRLELVSWLGFVNEIAEIGTAVALGLERTWYAAQIGINMLVFLGAVALSRWGRLRGTPVLQAWLTPILVTLILLTWQGALAVLAANGRLSVSYPLVIMATALVLVWPPRALVAVMLGTLATYVAIVALAPVSPLEQGSAIRTAIVTAILATVAGLVIHSGREENHRKTQELHDRNGELARRQEEMDELMAFAAHDLRSPLYGLRNLMDFARERIAANPGLARPTLDEASRSVSRMLALIGALLERHEAEYGRLAPVPGDLRPALRAGVARNRAGAEAAGVVLRAEVPGDPVPAVFDDTALARILDNLLANALRFTPPGRAVLVRCAVDGTKARLWVLDEGVGVPAEDRADLFGKFRRGSAAAGGAGLGLFISGVLAQRMGGRAAYRPNQPEGSVFEIALPRADGVPDRG